MKIWEICKEKNEGKTYKDDDGEVWEIYEASYGDGYDLKNGCDDFLSNLITISQMAEMEFTEIEKENIDWSAIPVDKEVLVRTCRTEQWNKRHFAKYEDGKVYSWKNGRTSFSSENKDDVQDWKYAKLYKGN